MEAKAGVAMTVMGGRVPGFNGRYASVFVRCARRYTPDVLNDLWLSTHQLLWHGRKPLNDIIHCRNWRYWRFGNKSVEQVDYSEISPAEREFVHYRGTWFRWVSQQPCKVCWSRGRLGWAVEHRLTFPRNTVADLQSKTKEAVNVDILLESLDGLGSKSPLAVSAALIPLWHVVSVRIEDSTTRIVTLIQRFT